MTRPRLQIAPRRQAFTLVELLVVMAIILLLAAVTLPTVKALLHGQKLTQASRMVQAHVESARARAIASSSHAAVILERLGTESNTSTRLSIGQVFPPYQGDITGATGTLSDTKSLNAAIADGYFDQLAVDQLYGGLLYGGVFGAGDFIQLGDRESLFIIESWSKVGGNSVIKFANSPYITRGGVNYQLQEPELPTTGRDTYTDSNGNGVYDSGETFLDANGNGLFDVTSVTFRIFRKPTKSFVQSTVLPRGTCVDLFVSGIGASGSEFQSAALLPVMIVFDERGTVAYVTDGTSVPERVSGIIHLLVGRTEQVSTTATPLSVKVDADTASYNSNINDTENFWVSINPYSGAVYSSAVQAGSEAGPLTTRLNVARSFASSATTRSVD